MQTLASPPSSAVTTRKLTSIGHELELDENSFGWLEDSSSIRGDAAALQQRMDKTAISTSKDFSIATSSSKPAKCCSQRSRRTAFSSLASH